jgi:hypothetical protein
MKTLTSSSFRQALIVGAFALSVLRLSTSQLGAEPVDPTIVELPKFEVAADRILPPLEKWRYVSIPGYEILSNASQFTTRRFVKEFYLVQQVAQVLLPRAESVNPLPTYVVLCDRGNAFSHFMPQALVGSEYEVRSLFYHDQERTAIITDLSPGKDDDGDFNFNRVNEQYFRQIVRRNLGSQAPYWLEEGLCRLFADINYTTDWVEFGRLKRPGFGFEPETRHLSPFGFSGNLGYFSGGDFMQYGAMYNSSYGSSFFPHISSGYMDSTASPSEWDDYPDYTHGRGFAGGRALIPLKEFFTVTNSTEATRKYGRTYSNQAYLFVHMCLYGRGQRYQEALAKLIHQAVGKPVTEEMFEACFGENFRSVGIEMRGYAQSADYRYEIFSGTKGRMLTKAPDFKLRDATEAESGRIAGEVLRLAGHRQAALDRLIAPYIRGDRSPDLLAALGLTELWAGQTDRARKFIEVAVANKTTRARAYVELGNLRFQDSLAKAIAEKRQFTDEEVAFAMAPLKAGFQYQPVMPEMYHALAHVWFRSATPPSLADYKVLLSGAHRYPRDLRLIYNLAAVGVVKGYPTESRPLVEHGLQYAKTDHAKKSFALLASKLPPSP